MRSEEAAFRPWSGHQAGVQHPDGIAGPDDPTHPLPLVPEPYTREQVLAYAAQLADRVRNHAGVGVEWVSTRAADATN